MSNLVCPVCGSSNIQTERRPDGFHHCMYCRHIWKIVESQPKPTVFDHITQSVEVLAEKLLYYDYDACDDNGIGYPWCSTLFADGGHFETEEKAKVATIKELKKEYKGGKDTNVPTNGTDTNVGIIKE